MNINPFEKITFPFEAKGELTNLSYQGTFTIKPALNLSEFIELNNEQRRLLNHPQNNETIDPESFGAAMLLARFKSYITDAPSWFNETEGLKNCYDLNIPVLLNNKIQEEIKKWNDKIASEANKAKNDLAKT